MGLTGWSSFRLQIGLGSSLSVHIDAQAEGACSRGPLVGPLQQKGQGEYTMLLKAMAWNWTTVTSTFFPLATLNHMTKPKIMG